MGAWLLPADGRMFTAEVKSVIRIELTGDVVPAFARWHDEQDFDESDVTVTRDTVYRFEAIYATKHQRRIRRWLDQWAKGQAQ